jgi:hypothetical protein
MLFNLTKSASKLNHGQFPVKNTSHSNFRHFVAPVGHLHHPMCAMLRLLIQHHLSCKNMRALVQPSKLLLQSLHVGIS